MPPQATGSLDAARRAQHAAARRARRFAGLTALAVVAVATLLLTAFGPDGGAAAQTRPAPASRLLPAGQPEPLVVATLGSLRIQLPIEQNRVTAIGYHGAEGALALEPVGRRGNQGVLARLVDRVFGADSSSVVWYQLAGGDGPSTAVLDVGAAPGTDVYSPVDGTILALTEYVIDGETHGVQIDIRPTVAPSVVLSLTHVRPDPALTVGRSVAAGSSRLGTLLDLSSVERQTLARFTQDAGNHVSVQVRPAAALALP